MVRKMAKNLVLSRISASDVSKRNQIEDLTMNLDESAIVLLEDGVIGINSPQFPYMKLLDQKIPIFCLIEDLEARGFAPDEIKTNIKKINYDDLIDLIDKSDRIISWL